MKSKSVVKANITLIAGGYTVCVKKNKLVVFEYKAATKMNVDMVAQKLAQNGLKIDKWFFEGRKIKSRS